MKNNVFIHESSYVDEPCKIGDNTKIWHFSHVQKGAVIGENCNIGQNVNISGDAVIGNNVKIQNNVSVYSGVVLEDYVFCGPSMVFTNDINPRSEFSKNGAFKQTLVKKGATIGANSTIVCGTTLGKYCFVGAGSVVTRDVGDYHIVVGNPARIHGYMCRCGTKISFNNDMAKCTCNREFKLVNKTVEEID